MTGSLNQARQQNPPAETSPGPRGRGKPLPRNPRKIDPEKLLEAIRDRPPKEKPLIAAIKAAKAEGHTITKDQALQILLNSGAYRIMQEAVEEYGISPKGIEARVRRAGFTDGFDHRKTAYIPSQWRPRNIPETHETVEESAERTGLDVVTIRRYIRNGSMPDVVSVPKMTAVPIGWENEIEPKPRHLRTPKAPHHEPKAHRESRSEGFTTVPLASKQFQVHETTLRKMAVDGKLGNSFLSGRLWALDQAALQEAFPAGRTAKERVRHDLITCGNQQYVPVKYAARLTGHTTPKIYDGIRAGRYPGSKKINGYWHIPLELMPQNTHHHPFRSATQCPYK